MSASLRSRVLRQSVLTPQKAMATKNEAVRANPACKNFSFRSLCRRKLLCTKIKQGSNEIFLQIPKERQHLVSYCGFEESALGRLHTQTEAHCPAPHRRLEARPPHSMEGSPGPCWGTLPDDGLVRLRREACVETQAQVRGRNKVLPPSPCPLRRLSTGSVGKWEGPRTSRQNAHTKGHP